MTEEPKIDLKKGEEAPTGVDQTGAETTKSTGAGEATGATGASGATGAGATGATGPSGAMVQISKSELEKLQKDAGEKENYRKAVIRLNRTKGRVLPGAEPEKKPKVGEGDEFATGASGPTEDKFVTKNELTLRDEKRAISDASKDEEILLNWDEIIVFYQRPKENTYDTQLAAINNAHKLWRADKGLTDKPDEETEKEKKAKKAKKDLANDKDLGTGKEKKPAPLKKTIIPRKSKMEDWYPDKK